MTSIAPKRAIGPVRVVRRTSITPAVARPTARQLARLCAADRRLLFQVLREPVEYVDHVLFHGAGAERILFGVSRRLLDQDTALGDGPGFRLLRPAGSLLVAAEETTLFQTFNYARMRQVRLLRGYRKKRMPLVKLRLLLLWAGRAAAARCRIVEANMPLVLAMARRARPAGIDFSELISEGNFALLRSVDKFDCSRGFKFSTYACRAILKSFSRVMMRNGRYRSRFPVEFEPSLERSDHIETQRQRKEGDSMQQITTILADNRAALNDMEQQVIDERFAMGRFHAVTSKTLEQVGEDIGVTKERVRQIQNRALRKIRSALEDDLWT